MNQIRKSAAGAVIHNDINNYPFVNIPMIINEEDGMIYEVFSAGFHVSDAAAMITTADFATNRVNAPIVTVKNNDGSIQAYRLPLELEHWVLSCMHAASAEKNRFHVKLLLESSTQNSMWNSNE
ncbi:group-specific protein (plasmid) [Bacillus thuringiensis MC28]|nr:group-specific protein [Bacillus thuringiensis MC28]